MDKVTADRLSNLAPKIQQFLELHPDEQAAAGINFMDAETWRMRFTRGIYEIRSATPQQVKFLEDIKLN